MSNSVSPEKPEMLQLTSTGTFKSPQPEEESRYPEPETTTAWDLLNRVWYQGLCSLQLNCSLASKESDADLQTSTFSFRLRLLISLEQKEINII